MHPQQSYLIVGAASTSLPVALSELKAHLNIIGTNDDARLTALQWGAVDWIERQTDRSLVTTAFTEVFSQWPTWWNNQPGQYQIPYLPIRNTPTGLPQYWGQVQRVTLSRSPVASITSLGYYDVNNTSQALTAGTDYYLVNPTDRPAFLQPVSVWPIAYYRPDSVQIQYSAGYSPLPGVLNAAIKLLVGAWNENREDFNSSANMIPSTPIGVQAMINSIVTGRYF